MESSLSEEVPLAAEDAELPDMVPVSIRTTLPEFQHYNLDRVLAGVLLSWKEFLQLFDVSSKQKIEAEASDYVIKGHNGTKFGLNEKVQDYVNSYRRKLKIYQVTLERTTPIVEMSGRRKRGSVNSENSNSVKASGSKSTGSSKKTKLMDEEKQKRNQQTSMKESLTRIAQSVMQGQTGTTSSRRSSAKKGENKRESVSVKSRSPTPPTTTKVVAGPSTSSDPSEPVAVKLDTQVATGKLKRLSMDHSMVKEIAPSSSSSSVVTKRGRKPKKTSTLSSRRSTKESLNTVASQESNQEESSETEDEEFPSKDKKKLLKQNVIKFLSDKVSPRSFLRLRNELMGLRDQEKYFKVTSVAPMTAGMMEQAFCRKLTE